MAGLEMEQNIDPLIDEFIIDLKTKGVSSHTITEYPRYVMEFHAFIGGGDLLAVDETVVKNYLVHLRSRTTKRVGRQNKLAKSSIKKYMAALSVFFDFLFWNGKITINPVPRVRKQYMRDYKAHNASQRRRCITIPQAKTLVESILDPREKAVVLLLLKTGMRRHELAELDLSSVDLPNLTIHIKPTAKRSNEIVYFDSETANILSKWLKVREKENKNKINALFLDRFGNRLSPVAICRIVTKHAAVVGLHDPSSIRLEDKLTPHSLRHAFTTWLTDAGMKREMIQFLRGDTGTESIDTYIHFTDATVKRAYLEYIPKLNI
jgi:integrase/recombinase XerD